MHQARSDTIERGPVVVDGLRTPFAERGGALRQLDAARLGTLCIAELVARAPFDAERIDRVILGRTLCRDDDNLARQVVMRLGLAAHTDAYDVQRDGATSYQALTNAAQDIRTGDAERVVAGGIDSASHAPSLVPGMLAEALEALADARNLRAVREVIEKLAERTDTAEPTNAADPFTGLRKGDASEYLANTFDIDRQDQDYAAQRSHRQAAAAFEDGRLQSQVMSAHLPPHYERTLDRDTMLRPDRQLSDFAGMPPQFDPHYGTVTAGNSAAVADGVAALLLMPEAQAQALGVHPLGRIVAHAAVALDPNTQTLMGPAFAIPQVLQRAGMALSDLDLVDIHEASGAQLHAVRKALDSDDFAREQLQRPEAVGELDWDRLNVDGGSLAFGDPPAATGARQVLQTYTA